MAKNKAPRKKHTARATATPIMTGTLKAELRDALTDGQIGMMLADEPNYGHLLNMAAPLYTIYWAMRRAPYKRPETDPDMRVVEGGLSVIYKLHEFAQKHDGKFMHLKGWDVTTMTAASNRAIELLEQINILEPLVFAYNQAAQRGWAAPIFNGGK